MLSLRFSQSNTGSGTNGALMTGPEHLRRAEELAAEAHRLLGQVMAGVWAAVALTHAVLALAAATAVGTASADSRAWADVAGTRLQSGLYPPGPDSGPAQQKAATGK